MRRCLIVCLLPLLAACTKSDKTPRTPPFTVTAVLDGTPTTFNAIITVDSASTPGTVYIVAHSDSANLTPLFEITLTGRLPFKPGNFTSVADSTGSIPGLIGYTGWQGGSANQFTPLNDTIVLTTVNNRWLAGTFQGAVSSADSVIMVSNGQFTVGWNQQ